MSLTVDALVQADWSPPRVELNVLAGSPLVDDMAVTCVRVHPDGSRHAVITPADLRLSSSSAVFYDYHPPRGVELSYEITVDDETTTAEAMRWVAVDPNIMPVDPGTGGEARMLEWVRSSGGLTTSINSATLVPGETITAKGIPVTDGTVYTFGINASNDATASLQFRSGSTLLGTAETASTTGLDRPVVTVEAPAGATLLDVSLTNDTGGNITASGPTLLVGTAYPTQADPVTESISEPLIVAADPDEVWLLHRSNAALSVRLDALSGLAPVQRAPWVGAFRIPGRRNTVHVTDGVLHGGTGQLDARCDSDASLTLLLALLADGSQFCIATPGTAGWNDPWLWVQPVGVSVSNPGGIVGYAYRHVVIDFEETDQPAVAGVGTRTYAVLKTDFTGLTYADLKATYDKYRDLKTDTRIA